VLLSARACELSEIGAEQTENGMSGSGAVSRRVEKTMEQERSGLNQLLQFRSAVSVGAIQIP